MTKNYTSAEEQINNILILYTKNSIKAKFTTDFRFLTPEALELKHLIQLMQGEIHSLHEHCYFRKCF